MEDDEIVPYEKTKKIQDLIYVIRDQQIMIDVDLAEIYGYTVKALNQQVKRNSERFPYDFMFQLSDNEFLNLKSQNVTSSWGGTRKPPWVFTEQGIYMLATVLNGELAIKQSLVIMRTFKKMRHYIAQNQQLFGYQDFKALTVKALTGIQFDITQNRKDIENLMNHFIEDEKVSELVILDGQKFEADEAYINIYKQARDNIIVIDDYINIDTLSHMKNKKVDVKVIIVSDNKGMGSHKLRKKELDDFNSEYPFLEIRENKVSHDRFIIIDYDTKNEMVYHCGTSSKDAGRKLCAINRFSDISPIHDKIKTLITHPIL